MNAPEKVGEKLRALPDKPGCYLMRDAHGHIIYVGKASSLRRRVQSYFRRATLRRAPPKLLGLIRSVADIEWIVTRTEAEAALTEGRLIKDYRPHYNTLFKDDKRFLLIKVDLGARFPRFQACRIKRNDGAAYFGPCISSAAARTALEFLEKRLGLRRCAAPVPDAETHRHCIDDIVRYCSAPCLGRTTREAYMERVMEACAILRGARPAALKEIAGEMSAASAAFRFEKAAALRDALASIRMVVRQNALALRTPAAERERARSGVRELRERLGLSAPPRIIEAIDVSCISGTHAVAGLVCAADGLPRPERYRRFRIRTVAGMDDPGMMREAVLRRYRRLRDEGRPLPDLLLVDGGVTQLAAAREALRSLGLDAIPAIGLAKRYEEVHVREDLAVPPLRLPADSDALKVLQRIRDEAHRFALAYHRRLRERRIRESALDDIPGIGEARKRRLLARFGSVRGIAAACEDELAGVPGVGPALARLIRQTLAPGSS